MTLPKSLELRLRPCLLEKQEQVDWTSHSQTPNYPQAVCAGKDRPLDNSKTDDEMSRPSHPGHWAHYRGEGVLLFVRRSSGGAGRRGGGSRVSQKNVRGRQRKSDLGSHR